MSGPHLGERLSVFLDGELSAADRAAAVGHLRECAACARELEELSAVDALAREEPLPVPDGYFEALPRRVRDRIRERRRIRPAVWTAAAAAAAVVLVSVLAPLTLRHAAPVVAPTAPMTESAPRAAAAAAPAPRATAPPELVDNAVPPAEPPAKRALATRQAADQELVSKERAAADRLGPSRERLQARDTAEAAKAAAPPAQAPGTAAGSVAGVVANGVAPSPAERKDGIEERVEVAAAPPAARKPLPAPAPAVAERKLAGGGAFAHSERASLDDPRYRSLAARRPASAAEARALRDAWELFARDTPDEARADEARVRAIESSVTAWRLGGAAADLAVARAKARAYLAAEAAPQRARVQAVLDGLPPEP